MLPAEYNKELADTIYQEVVFVIQEDQFPDETGYHLRSRIAGFHKDKDEVELLAREIANETHQDVEVEVRGRWGHYGEEYVESFTVRPDALALAA